MVTSPNLGLKIWNLTTDAYNSAQLADNWARVDQHTHAFGMGAQIPTGGVADGAITQIKLDPGITTTPTDGSVSTVKLASGAVTTAKLGNSSVTASKILSLGTPVVTALPSAPVDGQICAYNADPTNGVIWMFRYRSASGSGHKWEFIGGGALFAEVVTTESIPVAGYTALATAGPSLTLPLNGDYEITHGAHLAGTTFTNGGDLYMSFDSSLGAASDNDAAEFQWAVATSDVAPGSTVTRQRRKNGLTAGSSLTAKYRSTIGGTLATAGRRFMSVRPARVG